MITKNYKSIFSYVAALTVGLFMLSCDQEDNTGFSTLVPTSPNLDITVSETNVILVENDQVFEFTASISQVQLVDVKLYAFQADGDADGDDYALDGSIVIPAGTTSATGKLTILKDDILEDTETLKVQIGNNKTANTTPNSAFIDITILNYTEGDLILDMNWAMSETTTDNSGEEIDPEDFADLRLLISSTPDNAGDIGVADDSGFKTFVLSSDTPDGMYYVVADFTEASSIVKDLDLLLDFNQTGVINNDSYDYPSALNTGNSCATVYYVMAELEKNGESYTITRVGEKSLVLAAPFLGSATVVLDEWEDFVPGDVTTITAGDDENTFLIDVPDYLSWITNNATADFIVTIDPATGNATVTGTEDWIYSFGYTAEVTGSGSVNACTGEINLVIDFLLDPYGPYNGYALVLQSDNF